LDINIENTFFHTPLQLCLNRSKSIETISYLLENKASLCHQNRNGHFCFESLISNFDVDINLVCLLEKYTTPLVFKGSVIKLLIEKYENVHKIPDKKVFSYLDSKGKNKNK
jgi:ankyrin repeat protein